MGIAEQAPGGRLWRAIPLEKICGGIVIDQKTFNFVAQMSHWLGGAWLTLVPVYFWGKDSLYYSIPIIVSIAAFKEFYIDYHYENEETRGSSMEDFLFYCLGISITVGMVFFL